MLGLSLSLQMISVGMGECNSLFLKGLGVATSDGSAHLTRCVGARRPKTGSKTHVLVYVSFSILVNNYSVLYRVKKKKLIYIRIQTLIKFSQKYDLSYQLSAWAATRRRGTPVHRVRKVCPSDVGTLKGFVFMCLRVHDAAEIIPRDLTNLKLGEYD